MKFFSKNKNTPDSYLIEDDEIVVNKTPAPENPNVLTVDEVLGKNTHKDANVKTTGALDALKKRMLTANGKPEEPKILKTVEPQINQKVEPKSVDDGKTLLEKCRPYILDEKHV